MRPAIDLAAGPRIIVQKQGAEAGACGGDGSGHACRAGADDYQAMADHGLGSQAPSPCWVVTRMPSRT